MEYTNVKQRLFINDEEYEWDYNDKILKIGTIFFDQRTQDIMKIENDEDLSSVINLPPEMYVLLKKKIKKTNKYSEKTRCCDLLDDMYFNLLNHEKNQYQIFDNAMNIVREHRIEYCKSITIDNDEMENIVKDFVKSDIIKSLCGDNEHLSKFIVFEESADDHERTTITGRLEIYK